MLTNCNYFWCYDDLNKIIYHFFSRFFLQKMIFYLDELINKDKVEDLTIKLAMCMAASDGHLSKRT